MCVFAKGGFHSVQNVARSIFSERFLLKCVKSTTANEIIGGPKMSGHFVHCKRERQRIVYCKQYAAARACSTQNFPTFLGHL